jgi:hypothetical protein
MPLTNDTLSVWELGHRLAGENPYRWRLKGAKPAVRDNFRLLLNEIHTGHLESSLLMEKRPHDSHIPSTMYIRHHLDTIEDCVRHGLCKKKFLEFVLVERWEFRHWCQQSGYPLPDFWYGCEYRWPEDDEEDVTADAEDLQEGIPDHPDKLRTSQRTRVACQEIAKVLWRDVPETTITDMIDHEAIIRFGGGGYYEEKTRRKWLSQVAPPEVREKRGRPKEIDDI